jgi:hypothetical protein
MGIEAKICMKFKTEHKCGIIKKKLQVASLKFPLRERKKSKLFCKNITDHFKTYKFSNFFIFFDLDISGTQIGANFNKIHWKRLIGRFKWN